MKRLREMLAKKPLSAEKVTTEAAGGILGDNDMLLSRFKALIAESPKAALYKLLEGYSDEFYLWLLSTGADSDTIVRDYLPGMPSEDFQNHYTGSSGVATLTEAYLAHKLFKELVQSNSIDLGACNSVLDFGCGWGRIIRFFLKDVDASKLYGVDIDKTMIDICRQSNLNCSFSVINPMPPIDLPDNSIDIIYLYSVFTHLSEEAHLKWLAEFKRILRPGGIVIATTRPRAFILLCAELRKQSIENWQSCAAGAFTDTERSLAIYDQGGFCHSPGGGGVVHDKSFFGESCIPKSYVEKIWKDYFSFADHMSDTELKNYYQDVIVARK